MNSKFEASTDDVQVAISGDEAEKKFLVRFCQWVVRRRMTTLVIVYLEMHRPLSFFSSQVLIMLRPFLDLFSNPADLAILTQILERRSGVEDIIVAIEEHESQYQMNSQKSQSQQQERPSKEPVT